MLSVQHSSQPPTDLELEPIWKGVRAVMTEKYPECPITSGELAKLLDSNVPDHIDFNIDYLRVLFNGGLDRNNEVERKAALLVSASGIAAAILTALAGFLINFPAMLPDWSRYGVLVFYILLAFTFFVSVWKSMRVLLVGIIAYPGVSYSTLIEGQQLSTLGYKKRHIADLFVAYSRNNKTTSELVNHLAAAQKWFRTSVILLILTGLFVALASPLSELIVVLWSFILNWYE